jgi:methyl-accepting chemotaxis protein
MTSSKKAASTISRRMTIYMAIIVFTMLILGVEFFVEINSGDLKGELVENFERLDRGEITEDAATAPIVHVRNKVMLLLAVQVLVTGVVFVLFVKKINIPLKRMFTVSSKIAAGDMKEPMPVYMTDEIGRMGEFINDLVSDFGEIVAHVRLFADSGMEVIEEIEEAVYREDLKNAKIMIEVMKGDILQLNDMMKDFKLFTVGPGRER